MPVFQRRLESFQVSLGEGTGKSQATRVNCKIGLAFRRHDLGLRPGLAYGILFDHDTHLMGEYLVWSPRGGYGFIICHNV